MNFEAVIARVHRRCGMHLFKPILAGARLSDRFMACFGALFGMAATTLICGALPHFQADLPLLIAPIGASAVLVFAVPASPLAQPWPVFGGNVVSTLVGVTVARLLPDAAIAAGLAVAIAILAMSLLRCLHPPGGAAALIAVIGGPAIHDAGYAFAFFPVGANAAALLAAGWLFHRFSHHSYPHRSALSHDGVATSMREAGFHGEDVEKALADLGETFDVSREDLDLLLSRAEIHAQNRRAGGRPTPVGIAIP